MKSKKNDKSYKTISLKKPQKKIEKHTPLKLKVQKKISNKNNSSIKVSQKINKIKQNQQKIIDNNNTKSQNPTEYSSTNCPSCLNYKRINLNISQKNQKKSIPLLLSNDKESETESAFINFKLGEKDYIENFIKNDLKKDKNKHFKKINVKNNYDYCKVNKESGKNENDSLEIYDFNDEENVNYVLNNLANISSNKNTRIDYSNIFEDCNERSRYNDGEKGNINIIKIFEVKKNNISTKI